MSRAIALLCLFACCPLVYAAPAQVLFGPSLNVANLDLGAAIQSIAVPDVGKGDARDDDARPAQEPVAVLRGMSVSSKGNLLIPLNLNPGEPWESAFIEEVEDLAKAFPESWDLAHTGPFGLWGLAGWAVIVSESTLHISRPPASNEDVARIIVLLIAAMERVNAMNLPARAPSVLTAERILVIERRLNAALLDSR